MSIWKSRGFLEVGGRGHLCFDAVVAEVAQTAYVGVGEGRAFVTESVFIDFYAHALVGVSEWHACQGAAVHLLDREKVVVDWAGFEDMFIHNDATKHIFCHEETLVHQLRAWKENILKKLEITVITMRHIAAQHAYLTFRCHYPVAVSADDFPDIWIFLVRHYAGACGEGVREFDETIVGTHIHTAVRSKLVESQCNGSDCRCNCPFSLAAAQLRSDTVVIQTGEAQQVGCHLPVKRKRTAISGSGT